MAGFFGLFKNIGSNATKNYSNWRKQRIAANKAGTFLEDPGLGNVEWSDLLYNDKNLQEAQKAIIARTRNPNAFKVRQGKGRTATWVDITDRGELLKKLDEYIDPNNASLHPQVRKEIAEDIAKLKSKWESDPKIAKQRIFNNSRKIPGSDMRFNAPLMQQRLGMLRGLGALANAIELPMLAYNLANEEDKQGAFENFIGWTSPKERWERRQRMRAEKGFTPEQMPYNLSDEKSLDINQYATNGLLGAGIGALGGLATGAGIGTGALTGAAAGIGPMAAAALGYGLGSIIDDATGASSKIANGLWDLMHDDAAERAENDRKAATNPEVVNARTQIALKKELMQKYGLNAVSANDIVNNYQMGIPIEQSLRSRGISPYIPNKANTVNAQPANIVPQATNGVIPQNVRVVPSGVNFISNLNTPMPIINEREPESYMTGYTRDGRVIKI